jgi:hypothetical protein
MKSLSIKNSMARKTSVAGLSEICIQARPQILSLLSIDTPSVSIHMADTKQKMMRKLRAYMTAFILFYSDKRLILKNFRGKAII